MADDVKIPDPQLEAILETLTELLLAFDSAQGSKGAHESDPQLQSIVEELRRLYDVQTAVTATAVPTAKPVEPTSFMESLTGALGSLLAVVGAVVGALTAVVALTHSFVGALDPGLIEQFHRALKDLQATVGVAFTGIFAQGINFLQDLSAAIQPVFAALKPVVDQLVGAVLKTLAIALSSLTPMLLSVVPVLKLVADLFAMLSALLRPIIALYALFQQVLTSSLGVVFTLLAAAVEPLVKLLDAFSDGFMDVVSLLSTMLRVVFDMLNTFVTSVFGSGFQDIVKQVRDAFKELLKAVLIAAVKLSQLGGSNDFAERLKAALTNKGESAVGSTSIKSLEQIAKDMATASVNAAGTEDAKDATNADIIKTLDALIAANTKNADNIVSAITRNVTGSDVAAEVVKVNMDPVGYARKHGRELLDYLNPF